MTADEFGIIWDKGDEFIEASTSGSTGTPKNIMLNRHDMILSATATNRFFGLGAGSRFVCPMSFQYIGARMMLVRARCCGGSLVAVPPSNNFVFDGVADLLAIVPSQVDTLLDNPDMLARSKAIIIGGAPLDDERRNRLLSANANAFVTYGMTETCSHVALAHIGEHVFHALDGITFSTDNRGCLVIDLTGRTTSHIVTNDIVRLLSPTAFEWQGRYDNIINSGGIKIQPEPIEDVARTVLESMGIAHRGILVTGAKSDKWGTEAILLIERDNAIEQPVQVVVLSAIKSRLENPRKCPHHIIAVQEIPCTPNGKPARKEASARFANILY